MRAFEWMLILFLTMCVLDLDRRLSIVEKNFDMALATMQDNIEPAAGDSE